MPLSGTATVTAKYGPGLTATATVTTDIQTFGFDIPNKLFTAFKFDGSRFEYDISAVTTITITVASGNYTITLS